MKRICSLGIPLEDFTMGHIMRQKAEKNGDKTYMRFEDRKYSYREFHEISNRLGRALLDLGVEAGQHVAFMMENKPEQLLLYFALAKIGAVSVPVNSAAKGELLAYYLTQSDSTVLISDSGLVERFQLVQDQCDAVRHVIILDERGVIDPATTPQLNAEVIDYNSLLDASADELPEDVVRNRDVAMLLYTSGTTGPSKGNMVPH